MIRIAGRVTAVFVAAAAAAAGALLALAFVPTLFGAEALIVTSGSMGDAAPVGSVAITRLVDVHAIGIGDVVSFRPEGSRIPVTHRVIDVTREGGNDLVFRTKGDANPSPDLEPVRTGDRIHRVERVVPYAGHIVWFARSPAGGVVLFLVPIAGLLVDRRRRARRIAAVRAATPTVEAVAPSASRSPDGVVEGVAALIGAAALGGLAVAIAGRRRHPPRLAG